MTTVTETGRRRPRRAASLARAAVVALLALALVGCGGEDDPEPIPGDPLAEDPQAPQIGVHEAVEREGEEVVVVAFFVDRDGETLACDSLAESDPPRCADPSLTVEGLDVGALTGAEVRDDVTWSAEKAAVRGTVEDGTFRATGEETGDG